jgi:peroxiredoxin-like protein
MQKLPHTYAVGATALSTGLVDLSSQGLASIKSEPPEQFGGSGTSWSPETLLVAAVADCFILTFRAIARASNLDWLSLDCNVTGTLDREESITRFTDFQIRVVLVVPMGTDKIKATRLLEKGEHSCMITNSLKSTTHLEVSVSVAELD